MGRRKNSQMTALSTSLPATYVYKLHLRKKRLISKRLLAFGVDFESGCSLCLRTTCDELPKNQEGSKRCTYRARRLGLRDLCPRGNHGIAKEHSYGLATGTQLQIGALGGRRDQRTTSVGCRDRLEISTWIHALSSYRFYCLLTFSSYRFYCLLTYSNMAWDAIAPPIFVNKFSKNHTSDRRVRPTQSPHEPWVRNMDAKA